MSDKDIERWESDGGAPAPVEERPRVEGPVIHPDNKGQWILYRDAGCDEVIGFFPDRADAECCAWLYQDVNHDAHGVVNDAIRLRNEVARLRAALAQLAKVLRVNATDTKNFRARSTPSWLHYLASVAEQALSPAAAGTASAPRPAGT